MEKRCAAGVTWMLSFVLGGFTDAVCILAMLKYNMWSSDYGNILVLRLTDWSQNELTLPQASPPLTALSCVCSTMRHILDKE
ncbi:hypothetical protein BC826DRAFT_739808 [Russula brevipes]|nr:hypothetical protein BC826DRAFT_739808 [Russula brevipes]